MREPSVPFEYPRDEPEEQEPDRERALAALKRWNDWVFSTKSDHLRIMRASIGISLLEGTLSVSDQAHYHKVTPERIMQVKRDFERKTFRRQPNSKNEE
jgi:hypothetical protein